MVHAINCLLLALFVMFAASGSAHAHEGAGIVHFLSQPDHVLALIAAFAVAALVWIAVRTRKRGG